MKYQYIVEVETSSEKPEQLDYVGAIIAKELRLKFGEAVTVHWEALQGARLPR